MPSDVEISPIERNIGVDATGGETVVDEFLFSFTHNTQMDWMLPGVPPTGRKGRLFCCCSHTQTDFAPVQATSAPSAGNQHSTDE
jgi:hypothetical protein